MKKVTPMTRIIDIFSTAPLDECQQLLDAAQALVKSRSRTPTTTTKRRTTKTDGAQSSEGERDGTRS